jgi:cytochrome c biogenesis protein CcdA
MKRKGLLASFVLGLIFGVALGPCTFAYMAPMLAVTFKVAADQFALTECCCSQRMASVTVR